MGRMVQTELNEAEYQLLRQVSERKRKPLRALLRKAVIRYLEEEVHSRRVTHSLGHPSSKTGVPDGSVAHDKYLYGGEKRFLSIPADSMRWGFEADINHSRALKCQRQLTTGEFGAP